MQTYVCIFHIFWCSSVTQSCPTFCYPMDCSTPGFLVHHQLPEFIQTHVIESMMPFNNFMLCCPLLLQLQSFPASGSFPMNQFFASDGHSIGNSASASVLPINIQGWFPLGLTCLISLQSKGLSRVFSSTTVRNSLMLSLLYGPTLTPIPRCLLFKSINIF